MAAGYAWRMTLDVPLFSPTSTLSQAVRESIVTNLWPSNQAMTGLIDDFDAYFEYYRDQCHNQNPNDHVAQKQLDVVDIAQHINSNVGRSLSQLCDSLHRSYPRFANDPSRLSNSIELTARLWLMINVQNLRPGDYRTLRMAWAWPDNSSLVDVVQSLRRGAVPGVGSIQKFPDVFNTFDVWRMGGFRIEWTDNLASHLSLEGKTIYLYYHVSVLKRMEDSVANALLPREIFNETMKSLALLFPRSNVDCTEWLKIQSRNTILDSNLRILAAAPREVEKYDYWRANLLVLAETFDRSQPSNFSQWWYDRRNIVQWWTFWVAFLVFLLTIFFGLISSVTGVVQAWASVKGLNQS